MHAFHPHVSIVMITYNRCHELLQTLERLTKLQGRPRILVVDNASHDGTAERVTSRFPEVKVLRVPRNMGAAGRTLGVQKVTTPYVAFCDDDTWWEDGDLDRACELFAAHPSLAVVTARVLVGPENREDPICKVLAQSPLPASTLPGVPLVGFLAGASVMRRRAFLEAGGYHPRFFIGGEESLLAMDLLARGWNIRYIPELTVHHHPSRMRDATTRSRTLRRNELWLAWMRRPLPHALQKSWKLAREARYDPTSRAALVAACRGFPWALSRRQLVPHHVEASLRLVEAMEGRDVPG